MNLVLHVHCRLQQSLARLERLETDNVELEATGQPLCGAHTQSPAHYLCTFIALSLSPAVQEGRSRISELTQNVEKMVSSQLLVGVAKGVCTIPH